MPFRSCKSIRSLHFFLSIGMVLVRFICFFVFVCVCVWQFCFHLSLLTKFYIIDNNNSNRSNNNKSTFSIIRCYLFVCLLWIRMSLCPSVCVCVCLYVKQFCSCHEKLSTKRFPALDNITAFCINTQKRVT